MVVVVLFSLSGRLRRTRPALACYTAELFAGYGLVDRLRGCSLSVWVLSVSCMSKVNFSGLVRYRLPLQIYDHLQHLVHIFCDETFWRSYRFCGIFKFLCRNSELNVSPVLPILNFRNLKRRM